MVQERKNQKVDFSQLSTKICKDCGRPLKQNIVMRNPHAVHCYICFKISKGKKVIHQYKVVNGMKTNEIVRTINLLELQKQNRLKYRKRVISKAVY